MRMITCPRKCPIEILSFFVVLLLFGTISAHGWDKSFSGKIIVENNSCKPIKVLIHYLDADTDTWRTIGLTYIEPGEEEYIRDTEGERLETLNDIMYFWAVMEDGSNGWSGNENDPKDIRRNFRGKSYLMDMHDDGGYDLDLTLGTSFNEGKCPQCESRRKGKYLEYSDARDQRKHCEKSCKREKEICDYDRGVGRTHVIVDYKCAEQHAQCRSMCPPEPERPDFRC